MTDLVTKDGNNDEVIFDTLDVGGKRIAKEHLVDASGASIGSGNPLPVSVGEIEVKNDSGNPLAVVDAPLAALVGEAVSSPGGNTVLGRLKTIATALSGALSVKKTNRTLTFAFKTVPAAGSGIQLCAADSTRSYLFVENTGIGDAVIAPGTSAPAINTGKPLNAAEAANKQGGSLELDGAAAQEWWAFSTPGTRILVITGV